jgi:3-hydroxyisobutyrate dehydrogenase-like beta-hydroxyacid dehydrogenase
MRIGFIGLGIMGSRMAMNLVGNGHQLFVYNRTPDKAEPLLAKDAVWSESPADVAGQVDILFTMLANPQAVEEVALDEYGFLDSMRENALWVDCSTVNPSFSRRMAAWATARGVRFLDAPVAGTTGPAEKGELLFLVGGDQADLDQAQPLFDVMGRQVLHVGGHGMGTSLKVVFNLLLGEAMLAFSEALALGQSLGIPQERLLEILPGSAVVAPFISGKRAKIAHDDYEAEFPLKWLRKDLQLASQTGYEEGVPLPAVNVAKEICALAVQAGYEDLDFSALCQFLARGTTGESD